MGQTNSYRYVNTNTVYALGQDNPNFKTISGHTGATSDTRRLFLESNKYYIITGGLIAAFNDIAKVMTLVSSSGSTVGTLYRSGTNNPFIYWNANTVYTVYEISSTQ